MIKFFRDAFRGLFQICVILVIIVLFIGTIAAFSLDFRIGIVVLIGGLIILILSAGLTSTILYMDERMEYIESKIYQNEKKSQIPQRNVSFYGNRQNTEKCPNCQSEINKEVNICKHCGENIQEYNENQAKIKEDEKKNGEKKLSEKKDKIEIYLNSKNFIEIEKILNMENFKQKARELLNVYGKSAYISYVKSWLKELGLDDIDFNEIDLE